MAETDAEKAARLEQEQEILKVRLDMVTRGMGVLRDGTRVDPEEFYNRDPNPALQARLELMRSRVLTALDRVEAAYREGNRDGRRAHLNVPATTIDEDWQNSESLIRMQEAKSRV